MYTDILMSLIKRVRIKFFLTLAFVFLVGCQESPTTQTIDPSAGGDTSAQPNRCLESHQTDDIFYNKTNQAITAIEQNKTEVVLNSGECVYIGSSYHLGLRQQGKMICVSTSHPCFDDGQYGSSCPPRCADKVNSIKEKKEDDKKFENKGCGPPFSHFVRFYNIKISGTDELVFEWAKEPLSFDSLSHSCKVLGKSTHFL